MPLDREDLYRRMTASGVPACMQDSMWESLVAEAAARDAAAWLARVVAQTRRGGDT